MVLLSGLFAATNTTIREGRAAFPDFVFGGLADGGVSCGSEEGHKLGECREGEASKQYLSATRARRYQVSDE
jgi:hypothetical protein